MQKGGGDVKSIRITKKTVIIFLASVLSLCILAFSLCILAFSFVMGVDAYIVHSTSDRILTLDDAGELQDIDCILVLGCLVHSDGTPSHMLSDRLQIAVDVYESGVSDRLLMSGDNGREDYNEVAAMKSYAEARSVPTQNVFTDHAGFSTYESVYRAKEIFCADRIIIVTQSYHLHRALYIARSLGIEAYGVSADVRGYSGQIMRDVREVLARNKDFFSCIFKPKPTYLGEEIPISGTCEY